MNKKTTVVTKVVALFALLLAISVGAQQTSEVEPAFSPMPAESLIQTNEEGVAIDGFDPVAYFDDNQAVKGLAVHNCEYLNKTWHFSSAENRDKFLANPEKFSPQYGGFCAHSLTQNKLVKSNPESFLVKDDKLYLYVNDKQAKKDARRGTTKFEFTNNVRDKNWLTFESDF